MVAPVIGAAIAGGALSALGGLFSNSSAKREAQRNRDFQERMANTSYQRGVEDLKAAGLNPMLAYMKGGADSPSGSVAQIENPARGMGELASSAVASSRLSKLIEAQTDQAQSGALAAKEQARKTGVEADILSAEVPFSAFNAKEKSRQVSTQSTILANTLQKAIADADLAKFDVNQLAPIRKRYQELMAAAAELGIPEKQADAQFWESAGDLGKLATFIRQFIKR